MSSENRRVSIMHCLLSDARTIIVSFSCPEQVSILLVRSFLSHASLTE